MLTLTARIKQAARELGFDECFITPVDIAPHADFYTQWLQQGRAGEMGYLARHVDKRRDPSLLAEPDTPSPQSLIVLAVNYYQFDLPPDLLADPSRGIIASYAWGDDYHELIRPLLYELDAVIRQQTGRSTPAKCLVDTGPVLERDWAQQAGLGFTGKNCCTIHPQAGSWLLLATILVPEVLDYDPPPAANSPVSSELVLRGLPGRTLVGSWQLSPQGDDAVTGTCGRCTRCLTACPTAAFVGPLHLDPQRCISYWTIEARSPIPRALRAQFGNRIFGCDICQEVCPWNRRLPPREPRLAGLRAQWTRVAPPLLDGFAPDQPYWLHDALFRRHFQRSPILRTKRHGMLRNVCVALGNWADPVTIAPLTQALHDPEPLPRGHAAWALGEVYRRHGESTVRTILEQALTEESEPWVRAEIQAALQSE